MDPNALLSLNEVPRETFAKLVNIASANPAATSRFGSVNMHIRFVGSLLGSRRLNTALGPGTAYKAMASYC